MKFRGAGNQLPFPSHIGKAQGRVGLRRTDANEQGGRPPNYSVESGRSSLCIWSAGCSVLMSDLCISCQGDNGISHHGKQSCSSFQPWALDYYSKSRFLWAGVKMWWWISWDRTKKCPFCVRPFLLPLLWGLFIFSELLGVMLLQQQEVSAPSICNSELRLCLLLWLEYIHLHGFKMKNRFVALTGHPQLI